MTVFDDIQQNSDAWFALRRGRPTASRFKDIVTAAKCDLSKSSREYIRELIGESFCPDYIDWAGNKWTDRGQEMEPVARDAFREATGETVEEVGFCLHDNGVLGCSPDGLLVSVNGKYFAGLEIKCRSPKHHVGMILDGVLPDEYKAQVHGSMVVTGLSEWHFWGYYPGLRPLHLVVTRDDYTAKLERALEQFVIDYAKAREEAIPKLQLTQAA